MVAGLLPSENETNSASGGESAEARRFTGGEPTAGLQAEEFSRLMVCRARFVSPNDLARAMRSSTGASKTHLPAEIRLEREERGPFYHA